MVALLFVSSGAMAAPMKVAAVHKSPFKGLPIDSTDYFGEGCKSTVTVASPASLDVTNGDMAFNGSVGTRSCADLTGSDYSEIAAEIGYNGSSWTQSTTAGGVVSALFNLSWTAAARSVPSAGQSSSASVSLTIYIRVTAAANSTTVASGFGFPVTVATPNGSAHSMRSHVNFRVLANGFTYTAGDVYYLTTWMDVTVYDSSTTGGTSVTSASISLEPGTSVSRLASITEP